MAKFLDITGKKFGRLRVIKFSKEIKAVKEIGNIGYVSVIVEISKK